MTPRQVNLVRDSLRAVAPQQNRLAAIFLDRLLAREPQLRRLFDGDPGARVRELHDGLSAIVASLDRLHAIAPVLEWLAVRGARRSLGPGHYPAFAEALLALPPDPQRDDRLIYLGPPAFVEQRPGQYLLMGIRPFGR